MKKMAKNPNDSHSYHDNNYGEIELFQGNGRRST